MCGHLGLGGMHDALHSEAILEVAQDKEVGWVMGDGEGMSVQGDVFNNMCLFNSPLHQPSMHHPP